MMKKKFVFACESVVRLYLPAMRASIAKKLYAKGFTQKQIANELGLTQPAVSKYLSNSYGSKIREMEKLPKLEEACAHIASNIASKERGRHQVNSAICAACTQFNSEDASCGLLTERAKR